MLVHFLSHFLAPYLIPCSVALLFFAVDVDLKKCMAFEGNTLLSEVDGIYVTFLLAWIFTKFPLKRFVFPPAS